MFIINIIIAIFNMKVDIEKHFDTVIEVNTTYIASEAGHPRVYYKIKLNSYVVLIILILVLSYQKMQT